MTAAKSLPLPRDSTRQSRGLLYGPLVKRINRTCGGVIIAFVIVHVVGLAVVYWSAMSPVLHALPWLDGVNRRTWFHAIYFILFPAIVFHTLYSLKLIAMDFGLRVSYRISFWVISVLAVAAAFWGAFGYVSH
jgi:succinate dehydrogenase/fumarate reductase cytochrome b subunit